MKSILRGVVASLLMACGGAASNAAVVFSDNFDGYANQAAFEAQWPAVTPSNVPASGTLSTAEFRSAPNSVLIPVTTTTANTPRNQHTFTETGTVTTTTAVAWSFDFFDSAPTAAPFRQSANLQDGAAPATNNQLVSIGMNNNQTISNSGGNYYMARILGYTVPITADPDGGPAETVGGAGAYFKLNDFTAPNRTAGWHTFKAVISTDDLASLDYEFYVDNVLAERVINIPNSGSPVTAPSYEVIRIGSGVSSPQLAYYDNFIVETVPVPEPTAIALLGLAGAAGLIRRRRTM